MKTLMKNWRFWLALLLIVAAFIAGRMFHGGHTPEHKDHGAHTKAGAKGQKYHCPMHPTYVSDKPGDCPICNMALVPIEDGGDVGGMSAVAGRVTVKVSPERQQLIGLTTATVEKRQIQPSIRTVGRVAFAEPNVAWINTKVMGWIEKLHVDTTGQFVKKGESLLDIYSPELVSAQEEYLVAHRAVAKQTDSGAQGAAENGASLLASARRRLQLWDITDEQIQRLEQSGEITKTLTIVSPFDGHVIEKTALKGKAVMAGENLYRVADLSTVWIYADIYESDIPHVKVGHRAFVTASYARSKPVLGKIAYVYPYLEPKTRTVKVRIEAKNVELRLKPEMYVDVGLDLDGDVKLAVPASAVIDTGQRFMAFVDKGGGVLEPRELKIGARTDDYYEVLKGVEEGERVVLRALFLVDSESQLKAAISGMGASGAHQH